MLSSLLFNRLKTGHTFVKSDSWFLFVCFNFPILYQSLINTNNKLYGYLIKITATFGVKIIILIGFVILKPRIFLKSVLILAFHCCKFLNYHFSILHFLLILFYDIYSYTCISAYNFLFHSTYWHFLFTVYHLIVYGCSKVSLQWLFSDI